jgi:hypothetical protein
MLNFTPILFRYENFDLISNNYIPFRYENFDLYGGSDIISSEYIESTNLVTLKEPVSFVTVSKQLFNPFRMKHPTSLSSRVVAVEVLAFGMLC